MPVRIRLATPTDLPRIAELRQQVGWGVRPWALDAIGPPAGAIWVAIDPHATAPADIVGCGSGIVHGRLGIVGNMIVAESHRRRGIGGQVLRAVLDFLQPRCDTIELNATPSGRPLYERFGFEPIAGYLATNLSSELGAVSSSLSVSHATDAAALAAWDAERFGGNRLRILAAAIEDPERHVLTARGDELAGYAVARPTEAGIGPFVADSTEAARTLLAAAGEAAPSIREWRIVVPGDNRVATAWLGASGVELEPHGTQMRLGHPPRRRSDAIWGVGAGAVG
ncbi:MAG: GNAT family N-acetyltransferase [Chloroflexota bacterium]